MTSLSDSGWVMSLMGWLIAILLAVLSGVLAAFDLVVARASRVRVHELADGGFTKARRLEQLLDSRNPLTEALVFLRVLLTQATAVLVAFLLLREISGVWLWLVLPIAAVVVYLVQRAVGFGVARRGATSVAVAAAPFLWLISEVVGPIARLLGAPLRRIERAKEVSGQAHIELRDVLDRASVGDVIEPEEAELLHSVFEFGETIVRSVMVPRPDIVSLDAQATVADALEVGSQTGLSRLPVCEGDLDDIIGLFYVKDLLLGTGGRIGAVDDAEPVRQRLRRAYFVPEQKRTVDLLGEMRRNKVHMAIVVDEHGGTAGLVTLEDLLEEIVGDIADEYDADEVLVQRSSDGTYRVAGRYPLHDLEEIVGVRVEVEDADTVAGAMLALAGRVPAVGDEVTDARTGVWFRAVFVSGHRVETVDVGIGASGSLEPPVTL